MKKGCYRHSHGYIKQQVKGHPLADRDGYVMQHRLVAEKGLGRWLHTSERVHHKNGVRDDNRPENLEVWVIGGKDPNGVRTADLWREVEKHLLEVPAEHLNKMRAAFERAFNFNYQRERL